MQPIAAPGAPAASATRARRWGTIEVMPRAIATIAGRAVTACDGVAGIAGRHLRFGGAELLPPEHLQQGIDVHIAGEHITIDLYIIMDYGVRIPDVARRAIEQVKSAVERMLNLPVVQVHLIVQGLRVSDPHP